MADIEHALNSAKKCTEDMTDEDSGAGAIADSRADTQFITTSPLSELVWSQHTGLSLKYAASSLAEKKASLLWNTESFDIIFSSPQCTNVGESSNTRDVTAGTVNSLQLRQNSENYGSNRVTIPDSPRSILGKQPVLSLRIHEQGQGSFGEEELLKRKGKSVLHYKQKNNQSDEEVGKYSTRNVDSLFDILTPEADAFDKSHDKPSVPGPDTYGPSADSLLCNLKELRQDVSRVEFPCASYIEASSDNFEVSGRRKNYQTCSLAEVSACEESLSSKYESPMKAASSSESAECRHTDQALHTVEDNSDGRMTHHLPSFHPIGRQCSDGVQSLDFRGTSEAGMTAGKAKVGTWQASHNDSSARIWCQSDCIVKSSKLRKGKQRVLSDLEDSESISKEREDSHESVESISSRRKISTGKRASSPDRISVGSKNFKKRRNENSGLGALATQGSSFMNWISTITNGYTRSDQAKPLAYVPHPAPNVEKDLNSFPKSDEKSKDHKIACRTMGFQSFFQAIYRPSFRVQNSTGWDLDLQREADASKENRVASEKYVHGSCHMICDNVEFNSCNVVPTTSERVNSGSKKHVSSESLQLVCDEDGRRLHNQFSTSSGRLSQGTCQVEESPSTTINISSMSSRFHEKTKCNNELTCNLNDMGSPSSSVKIVSVSPSENKGTGILGSVPNSSSNMVTNKRTDFFENLWIRRLCPKVSSSRVNQGMELAGEMLTNSCSVGPNDVASNKEESKSGNCHLPSLQGQKDAVCGEMHSDFPIDLCGSKTASDQKLKSSLDPILPSQRFKSSEHMASVFAKRLDAFRHIGPSKVSDNATCPTTTCFFCGKSGHNIRECPELVKTELEDLLKNMNSYDGTGKSSCLCIRCFQLNHWAISCPHPSSKRKYFDKAFVSYENFNEINNKPGNPGPSNYDGSIILLSKGKKEEHQLVSRRTLPRRGNVRMQTELVRNANISSGMGEGSAPNEKTLCLNPVKEDKGESIVKLKPTSSSSRENESEEKQTIPYCNSVAIEVIDESSGVFETIRRLRLSRTDIIRWMQSPVSHFSLEGFFLRLRLGKLEEGLGGTGYQVACINGTSCEHCLSVCTGEFTYLVDCHSVSNHDFVEDELKAWLSATLKSGGKPPTMEELNKKLQKRMDFGF